MEEKKKFKLHMPHVLTLIFFLIIVVAILTWILKCTGCKMVRNQCRQNSHYCIRNCRIFKWICGNHSGRKTWRWITGNRRRVRNGCYYSGCAGRNQYVWRKRQTLGSCPGCADYRSTDKWTYYDKCIQLLAKSN